MTKAHLIFVLSASALLFSCNKSDEPKTIPLDISCIESSIIEMKSILDTATIGETDGTFPRENAVELQEAVVTAQSGLSKARAGEFILQFEVDNYCTAAKKAIQDFLDSYQITLDAGTPAELIVYGVDQKGRIEFGSSPAYGGGTAFTVESWLKYNSGFFESAIGDFIATFNNTSSPYEGWMINFMGENLRATIGVGPTLTAQVLENGGVYPKNYGEWNHIAMVYDESLPEGQLKMYVNGALFFSKTNDVYSNGVLQTYQPNTVNTNMWAFQEPTDNSRCMTGYIKKFRMWGTAKSVDELNILMTSDVSGSETDLICAWDFTSVPEDVSNIPDKTGRHSATIVGKYKWVTIE